jgi:hypothetical protein
VPVPGEPSDYSAGRTSARSRRKLGKIERIVGNENYVLEVLVHAVAACRDDESVVACAVEHLHGVRQQVRDGFDRFDSAFQAAWRSKGGIAC